MTKEKNDNHLYLVDGSGFIFRAFHALPPLTRPDGVTVNAVLGFTNMLIRLILDMQADHIAVIFDTAKISFRNDIYPEYKANRPPAPDELIPQFPMVRQACAAFNVPMYEREGFEADDLIATYAEHAKKKGMKVTIVSSDKDLMQLIDDGVEMFDPMKNTPIGPEQVMKKFGVGPDRVTYIQALAGDSTDNVPGIPGIGPKTAAELINHYGDLETLLENAGEIKQPKRRERLIEHADDARISYQLVLLKRDAPTEKSIEDFAFQEPDPEKVIAFLDEMSFKNVKSRLEKRGFKLGNGDVTAAKVEHQKGQYELVQDLKSLDKWIEKIHRAGRVAVDTETTSLDAMQADLVGVSLCVEEGKACYIPLAHKLPKADLFDDGTSSDIKQIPMEAAIARLKPVLEDERILKIGQNIKYDMLVLNRCGIKVNPIDDTMVMSYVLDGKSHGHGMDELALKYLDYETVKFKDVCGSGKNMITFDLVDVQVARDYAAEDADITLRLYHILKNRIETEGAATVYQTLDRPLIPILADMESTGIAVSVATLKSLSTDFTARLAELEQQIYDAAGHEFNIGSPRQLGEVMFVEMEYEGGKKSSKTGAYTTDADVLEDLASQGHHLPALVLEWRHLSKLKSTYSEALQNQIDKNTGRVHTSYGMTIASTGRLSSNNPNLQNIPIRSPEGLKIRGAFEAAKGHKFLSLDYSQIELRLLAHMADIPQLQRAFHEGQDIHAASASEVFGVPIDQVDSNLRSHAKLINFGIIYGISAVGLSRQLHIPRKEAADFIKTYMEKYPGIKDYMDTQKKFARENGFVKTLLGRKCFIGNITDSNPGRRGFAERAAINAPLQGTSSDILKKAMNRIPEALAREGLKAKMLLQIHDELVFEVPDDEIEKTTHVIKPIMENAVHLKIPLTVDASFGQTWADT